jgi:hypothetical protein
MAKANLRKYSGGTGSPAHQVGQESTSARFKLLYDLGCGFTARTKLDELLPFIIAKTPEALGAPG